MNKLRILTIAFIPCLAFGIGFWYANYLHNVAVAEENMEHLAFCRCLENENNVENNVEEENPEKNEEINE